MTLQGPLEFDLPVWDTVSDEAKELITGLLLKEANKRYTLDRVLAHSWFQKKGSAKK